MINTIKEAKELIKEYYQNDSEMKEAIESDEIQDATSEIADNNIDIYFSDLYKWVADESDWVERALDEFGWDGCGGDLSKAIQMGQSLKNQEILNEALEELK